MTIKTTGTSPSPSPTSDEAKMRPPSTPPADPKLTPDHDQALAGQGGTVDPALSPPSDQAKRPGGQGKGARRR